MSEYKSFLTSKIKLAERSGFDIELDSIHPVLKPHQKDVVKWAIKGARRAVFANFGLGKTLIQLEILRQVQLTIAMNNPERDLSIKYNCLIVCPLGVKNEFSKDGKKLIGKGARKLGVKVKYITHTSQIESGSDQFYITNYERIRKGDIDPERFIAVSFDEASILRSLETDTVNTIMSTFKQIKFRFVCTATPSPNRYLELINYADYLGIMDRGQTLTRFFQRDSTTAGNLTLYEKRIDEFWYWMSSWACFITKPSDLGHDDTGYDLPPINIHRHEISINRELQIDKFTNQSAMFANPSKSLTDAAREKRISLEDRLKKMLEIIQADPDSHYIIWHHLESERHAIQKALGDDCKSVYGSQSIEEKEKYLEDFSEGRIKYLSTKPEIAGSGCNFQYHCHKSIYIGVDYKFNDFIQSIHRLYRFLQAFVVDIHIIFTDAENDIMKALDLKWSNHLRLQSEMTDIIKKHGLNSDLYRAELSRKMFKGRTERKTENYHIINNDNVEELSVNFIKNSADLIVSSIPFGNHYEYSENYNCFGHNPTNEDFFRQMDFLVPSLFDILKPGRIAAIHVKDRIRYSYMNGQGFSTIDPFSDDTSTCFRKHGFYLLSRITITTDVVRENSSTYRLGWSEQCKDGTKMGNGLPEYVLVFRKPPTDKSNAYADTPVTHDKTQYSRGRWQLDAHAHWNSNHKALFSTDHLKRMNLSDVLKAWKDLSETEEYDYETHVSICENLDKMGKLPSGFMAIPPVSNHNEVWDDISRMNTLNSVQAKKNLEKHICPLQLDIIQRLIERYSNPGDIVLDPFAGIMSVPFQAVKMNRIGIGIELNTEYYNDGSNHMRSLDTLKKQKQLFNA